MGRRLSVIAQTLIIASAFAALTVFPAEASAGAVAGLRVCAGVIIPSLFPFFVLSGMLLELGLPGYIGRLLAPAGRRLFRISGEAMTAFILGLSGGYPLGASVTAGLYRSGGVGKREAERMLSFCNNSGPAFIIGAAGSGIFGSGAAGVILYLSHAAASVILGAVTAAGRALPAPPARSGHARPPRLPDALSSAVKNSVGSMLSICGFVLFFSVVMEILNALGVFSEAAGRMAVSSPLSLSQARCLLCGMLELGNGLASMQGLQASPENLALCSFIISWGGLSVHCQTCSALAGTGLRALPHLFGRLLHGAISAAVTYFAALFFLPCV